MRWWDQTGGPSHDPEIRSWNHARCLSRRTILLTGVALLDDDATARGESRGAATHEGDQVVVCQVVEHPLHPDARVDGALRQTQRLTTNQVASGVATGYHRRRIITKILQFGRRVGGPSSSARALTAAGWNCCRPIWWKARIRCGGSVSRALATKEAVGSRSSTSSNDGSSTLCETRPIPPPQSMAQPRGSGGVAARSVLMSSSEAATSGACS